MYRGYNTQAAERRLETLASERYNSSHSATQLSRITSASAHYEALPVGRTWSLVHKNTNDELVVSFQGIIVKKDLPPFVDKLGQHSRHTMYLRQSVSITGFATPTFAKALDATIAIHTLMGCAVGIDNMMECGMISDLDDVQVLEISNRYFKPRRGGVNVGEIAFSLDVDPHGYLTKAGQALGLYHSEDNVVQYFEREGSDDENYRYNIVKPGHFGQGDIVEVQASFALFPLKEGKFKSGMVLRGITLLDGTFAQAMVKENLASRSSVANKTVLKRRVGYGEEEMSVARAKMSRMDIDQRVNTSLLGSVPALLDSRSSSPDAVGVGQKTDVFVADGTSDTLD